MDFKQALQIFSPVGINYEGGVLPTAARQTIQMIHRFGALIVTLYFFIFIGMGIRKLNHYPQLVNQLILTFGLLVIQICLGIVNVLFKLPAVSAIAHNLIAALLLLSIVTFIFQLMYEEKS